MTAVPDAVRGPTHFEVRFGDGKQVTARKLLLASGVLDELPVTEGMASFDGRSVFHGPYCDGWNDQVEAQVNCLKLQKRLMFGRADFDLLRLRTLHRA